MLKSWSWVAGLVLVAAAGTAVAQDGGADTRWYISPSIGGVFADGDVGPAGAISIGRGINDHFGIEFEGGYSELDVGGLPNSVAKYERIVAGFNLLTTMGNPSWSARPFLLANANYHNIDFLSEKLNGAGVGLGGGLFLALSKRVDLRFEGRYNLDFINEKGVVPEDTFYIWTGTVGARVKFGADPGDDDGDGVPNAKDKCPDTPKGVQVYSDGCPIDLDQDGVPDYLDKCPNTPPGSPVDANGCPFDSDGDGVPDHLDQCPGTPAGVMVDARGCPLDSDGDGIPDYLDKCPDTRAGSAVNAQGCDISDKDGDGIPDHLDKCPDSDPSIKVGPDGCPLDSDGDGIPDHLDECPNTPPGLKVLPNGCALVGDCRKPRPGEAVDAKGCAVDQRFILRGVKFEFDSDRLTKPAELILNDVADTLAAYPDVTVEVQGHTDSLGTDAYNLGLSERRSNSVKRYLTGRGVNGDRLRPVGYGESAPIADNATPEGQEENRRVEFRVVSN
jgi:OmpA-OmpF porin, OOP family